MIDYQQLMIEYAKCYKDKSRIYMIQNFLKTYDATQKKEVPFTLFPRQQDLCRTLGGGNNVVTTKPRQAGITTTSGAFIACEMCLADKEMPQTVLAIGNTLDLAQQMLFKIRDFLLQFPLWMWGEEFMDLGYDIMKPPVNKNVIFNVCNGKELVLKNGCRVVARSSGPDASRGVGGVSFLIFDEAAFIENGADVYASALPTVSTGGHIIMISTPNGKDQLYYKTCEGAKKKGSSDWNGFDLVEMKWFQDPRYNKNLEWYCRNEETNENEYIKEETIDNKGNVKYDPERWAELEKQGWKARSPWYIKMCQQFNFDEQKIAQELDVSFLGSANNVVDPQYIEMQLNLNVMEPNTEYKDPLIEDTWVWKAPIMGHRYLMCIDASRGDAADRSALEVIDMDGIDDETGMPIIEQVLEYHGKVTGDDLGEIAYRYGKMYGDAFIVVDCIGGVGDACILTLMRLGYKNLYYDDPTLKTYTMARDASSLNLTPDGKLPGFHSSSVRFQMLTNFAYMVKTNAFKIRSKRVISELETWIYKGDQGRIDHMDGAHDDTLTCLAMGLFVMKFSFEKLETVKKKDAAILGAWTSSAQLNHDVYSRPYMESPSINITPKQNLPFYGSQGVQNVANTVGGNYMWLFAKTR